ncbi:transcription factor MYB34 [Gossypium australe]|uniref:Transcription factor MYB34 n=1 Tax=Gossypium australe TaxID=47621 RepID=A0A5B6X2H9_9ROSI|nr:transcription factor MYB34 [Gossypium australe]
MSLGDIVFMSIDQIIDLLPIDPKIERTFRQRRRQATQRRAEVMIHENQNQGNGANYAQNPILATDDRDRALR